MNSPTPDANLPTSPQASGRSSSDSSKGTYAFVSLGCPKNLVDSERMLGLLQLDGYQLVEEPDGSDFVIVNTCGFIEAARKESFSAIDQVLQLKREGRVHGVIVAGCLAERQKEQLLESRPEIDQLVGVFARDEITRIADRLLGDRAEQRTLFRPAPVRPLSDADRFRITPHHYAYLKISEGCDRLCTFCAIPQMRGKHASKPIDTVVEEARRLVDDGVRELIVVAQDTTFYGIDLDGRPQLTELLTRLHEVDADWIRLMYWYPMHIDDQLVQTIADSSKIVPYIDLPLQHINDRVLRRMSRRVSRQQTEQLLDMLRNGIADLSLRTTLITGFPGETEQEFEELADFVREQQFDRLGVFTYSNEPGTPAALLSEQVPEPVRERRRADLMEIQQKIAFARNRNKIGQVVDVILDQAFPDQANVWIGRSAADAPDVDALVYVTQDDRIPLAAGKFVKCEIVANDGYDLAGIAVDGPW